MAGDGRSPQLTLWWQALNFGGGPDEAYNINDPDFNATNWRSQKVIYIYDGKGEYVDKNNHKFTAVQLPWSDDVVESNLPMHFCDNVTPEQGWELVMNYCGSTISSNNNFFALYNKYTGVLRFFTYIPLDMNVSSASDHAWNVLLTEDIAQHLGMRYGLPMDQKIVNKVALGMTGTDYNVLVSPWVASLSNNKPSMKVLQHVDGTISTSGIISQSVAVAGIRNPTFPLTKFETSKSTLGQGVWNLRSAPVLYQIDGYFHYYRNYDPEAYVEPLTLFDKDRADYNLCFPDLSGVPARHRQLCRQPERFLCLLASSDNEVQNRRAEF